MEITVNTYGAYLHVKDEMFDIRIKDADAPNGVRSEQRAAHKVRTIVLSTGTMLSAAAVKLALKNNIDIVFVESDGHPLGRVWHTKLGSTTKIRKRQLEASLNTEGVSWVKKWIVQKVDNQLDFVKDLKKHRAQHADFLNDKIQRLEALIVSIQSLEGQTVGDIADTLRGLEGTAGRLYFETLSFVLPKEHQFSGRSMRPAKDAFNAFLNYAYGFLYRRTEKALMMAGVDPYVGFIHRDDYNQMSMVFDFIEPYRAWADESVFRLFSAKKINKSHTEAFANGTGIGLTKEGKALLAEVFTNFLDGDAIRHKNRNEKRGNILQLDAHAFANQLLGE
ncbi:MAG: CRISPR-associated endonuclease Cas1 [Saprospiraceae bacterium]|nr:CRISPR-associated endonuclease Cas1 [Saprospiraceae bacterium]